MSEEIKVGQVWQEVDPRYPDWMLHKTVVGFSDDGKVILQTGVRKTTAQRKRFNGKRGGYRLVKP